MGGLECAGMAAYYRSIVRASALLFPVAAIQMESGAEVHTDFFGCHVRVRSAFQQFQVAKRGQRVGCIATSSGEAHAMQMVWIFRYAQARLPLQQFPRCSLARRRIERLGGVRFV